MFNTINNQLNINKELNIISFFNDPLEQFALGQFFVCSKIIFPELEIISNIEDKCPFNIIKISKNVEYIVSYIWEISYYTIHDYFLIYLISPIYIVFLWILIGGMMLIILLRRVENKTNESTGKMKIMKKHNLLILINKCLYFIVKSIIKTNAAVARNEYFIVLCFLFFFILICNIFGLIPYTFTLTSSFIVTFFLAATHFIGINIIGFYKLKWNFFNLFLPSGVPLFIAPFLVMIELISYVAKVFSLSIRLFANMMSGHALLKILIGFSWTMLSVTGGVFYGIAIFPWLIVTLIMFLELLIAFLQAYVFVVLIAIYINDVTTHH